MKNIIQSAILLVVVASCGVEPASPNQIIGSAKSPEQFARQVIAALRHTSSREYVTMFPTLEDFHQMMDAHHVVYGESLPDAKREFGIRYETDLFPAVNESFARTVRDGMARGIAWSAIHFEQALCTAAADQPLVEVQVTIEFSANGKRYTVALQNVLVINGEWKAGTVMGLI